MAMSHAQRQRLWRKRQKLTPEGLLTRLFGQRLDLDDPQVAAFVESHTIAAKGVDSKGAQLAPEAVDILISSIITEGLKAMPFGWSLKQDGPWLRLQVHVLRAAPD